MNRILSLLSLSSALLAATACSSNALDDDAARDAVAPLVTIFEPERGTILPGDAVVVRGQASDDVGVSSITINGTEVELKPDGSFQATITTPPGVTLLQTEVSDAAGNQALDTRAVMAGQTATMGEKVEDALVARLNDQTFEALGAMSTNLIEDTDFAAVAEPLNPIVDSGGSCLGIEVDLLDLDVSSADVEVTPVDGGLDFSIVLNELNVEMFSRFAVACLSEDATIGLAADAVRVTGHAPVGLSEGEIVVDFDSVESQLDGLDVDVSLLPDAIVDLANGLIERQVEKFIVNKLQEDVPAMAEEFLADFTTNGRSFTVLGEEVKVGVEPTLVDFSPEGGTIALNSQVTVTGAVGPGHVLSQRPLPSSSELDASGQGMRLAFADDMVNQALSAFWASGALNLSLDLGADDESASLLGDLVDEVKVNMLLPPHVNADVNAQGVYVTVGDLFVDVIRKGEFGEDEVVTRLAVSAAIELGVVSEGSNLRLQTSTPQFWIDIVEDGVAGANILADNQVEALGSAAAGRVTAIVDDLVGTLPIPSFGGASLVDSSFEPDSGYVLLGGTIDVQ